MCMCMCMCVCVCVCQCVSVFVFGHKHDVMMTPNIMCCCNEQQSCWRRVENDFHMMEVGERRERKRMRK